MSVSGMNKIDINKEERIAAAKALFEQGYNCSQSVALAWADVIGLAPETLAPLVSGFGGGMGRMRQVCGCVSAMTLVCGAIMPASDPTDKARRRDNYALVQKLAGEFKEKAGSIICGELLSGAGIEVSTSPAPAERTPHYYRKRPCSEMVALAAGIIADNIANNE